MPTWIRVLTGLFLAAHGLVFLLYLVTEPEDPNWPFTFSKSWLIPETHRQSIGMGLLILTVVMFMLLALAVWGVPGLAANWPVLALGAAIVSAVLLVAFWQAQLIVGILIALALLIIALVRPEWTNTIG